MRDEFDYNEEDIEQEQPDQPASVPFPWGMMFIAVFFDLVGLIPFVNVCTEIVSGIIFYVWQRSYVPQSSPLLNFLGTRVADFLLLGFFPSNISVVLSAFAKKKTFSLVSEPQPATA